MSYKWFVDLYELGLTHFYRTRNMSANRCVLHASSVAIAPAHHRTNLCVCVCVCVCVRERERERESEKERGGNLLETNGNFGYLIFESE